MKDGVGGEVRHSAVEHPTRCTEGEHGSSSIMPRCAQIKDLGVKAGVVLNPGTSLTAIEEVLGIVDLVLLMSVNPGFGGQKFIETQVAKTRRLKQMCNELARPHF